jgi:hypothetical protein
MRWTRLLLKRGGPKVETLKGFKQNDRKVPGLMAAYGQTHKLPLVWPQSPRSYPKIPRIDPLFCLKLMAQHRYDRAVTHSPVLTKCFTGGSVSSTSNTPLIYP